jgi:hypothetical protein
MRENFTEEPRFSVRSTQKNPRYAERRAERESMAYANQRVLQEELKYELRKMGAYKEGII